MRWFRCFRCAKKIGSSFSAGEVKFPKGEKMVEVELCASCLTKVRAVIEFVEEGDE